MLSTVTCPYPVPDQSTPRPVTSYFRPLAFKLVACPQLILNLLTTTIAAPTSNASKWQMGFNSALKRLMSAVPTALCPVAQHSAQCASGSHLVVLGAPLSYWPYLSRQSISGRDNYKLQSSANVFMYRHLYVCLFSCRYNPLCLYFYSPVAGFSLLVFRGFLITHNDAPQSVGPPLDE